jgi:phosphatidylinositol-3-phosphatase
MSTGTRLTGAVLVMLVIALLVLTRPGHARLPATSGGPTASHAPASGSPHAVAAPTKVLVVVEENHSYDQMKSGMPFLAGVSDRYRYATHWTAITHPSEPNYLAIAGGSTFGVADDEAPGAHYADTGSATSVFDQALHAGKTAKTYAESMPENCHAHDFPEPSTGTWEYAVRHNPWVYFASSRSACQAYDVPLAAFAGDVANNTLPNVGFLIPDLCDDAHSCPLQTADRWLEPQLTPVLGGGDFRSGRLVVVVTADEDDKHSSNRVLTSVLSAALSGKVVDAPLTHYSLTRFIAQVLHVAPLRKAADAPDMRAAFGL